MHELRFPALVDRLAASTFASHLIMLIRSSGWWQWVVALLLLLGLQAASAATENGKISAPTNTRGCLDADPPIERTREGKEC
jgi:hypothetical protein